MHTVVYRWRVLPGREDAFTEGWTRHTAAIARRYGAHGSRLFRDDVGLFVAVAEWPDEATWRRAADLSFEHDDPEASQLVRNSVDGRSERLMNLTLVADGLTRNGGAPT